MLVRSLQVPISGTGSGLPLGPTWPQGPSGSQGPPGPRGPAGPGGKVSSRGRTRRRWSPRRRVRSGNSRLSASGPAAYKHPELHIGLTRTRSGVTGLHAHRQPGMRRVAPPLDHAVPVITSQWSARSRRAPRASNAATVTASAGTDKAPILCGGVRRLGRQGSGSVVGLELLVPRTHGIAVCRCRGVTYEPHEADEERWEGGREAWP